MQDVPSTSTQGAGAQTVRPAALRFRLAVPADFATCVKLLPPGFRAGPDVRAKLPDMWAKILASEGRAFPIFEDLERIYPASVEGFGLGMCVSDSFVEAFCASPRPYIAAAFYERMLAGEEVMQTTEQLAKANATTGVNILSLHFGLRNHDLCDARTAQVLPVSSAAFYFFHGGYRIRTLICEVYGSGAAAYITAGGFRLMHDFQKMSPAEFTGTPPEQYPYLFMLRREWIQPAAVTPLAQLFFVPAPRIGFSTTERRVLERALLNEADGSIARSLGISGDAVKKTWRNIHERVGRNAQFLMPEAGRSKAGSRGREKRRHLLDYLRTHMEELRPIRQ